MTDPIGVLVVDREPLFRRGLASCMKGARGIRVVNSVGTAEEAYRRTDELSPSVVIVGTTLPDAPGIAAAAHLRRHFPAVAVIVVASAASDDELFSAIRAGVLAYVSKDVVERELIALVRRTAGGEYVINEQLLANPAVAARVLQQFREAAGDLAPASAFAPLTERELQILQGVAFGKTNAQIGTVLGISGQTVKNHVTSILRKLAVNDRTQAVVLAFRRGWLPVDIPPQQAAAASESGSPPGGAVPAADPGPDGPAATAAAAARDVHDPNAAAPDAVAPAASIIGPAFDGEPREHDVLEVAATGDPPDAASPTRGEDDFVSPNGSASATPASAPRGRNRRVGS